MTTCTALAPILSLESALAGIALQEREWMEQGYCVGTLVADVHFWWSRGIITAADLDAYFDAEYERDERKASYWDEEDADYLAEMERLDAEEFRIYGMYAEERPTEQHILWEHYQPGWA